MTNQHIYGNPKLQVTKAHRSFNETAGQKKRIWILVANILGVSTSQKALVHKLCSSRLLEFAK